MWKLGMFIYQIHQLRFAVIAVLMDACWYKWVINTFIMSQWEKFACSFACGGVSVSWIRGSRSVSSITCKFAVAKVKESLCLIRLLKHVNRISLIAMTILASNAH